LKPGNNIVEHLAGLDDHPMAVAAYCVAVAASKREDHSAARGPCDDEELDRVIARGPQPLSWAYPPLRPAAEHGLMQVELRRFVARGDRGVARRDQGAVAASLAAIHHGNRATACWKAHQ
jgi:hypothetical protein